MLYTLYGISHNRSEYSLSPNNCVSFPLSTTPPPPAWECHSGVFFQIFSPHIREPKSYSELWHTFIIRTRNPLRAVCRWMYYTTCR